MAASKYTHKFLQNHTLEQIADLRRAAAVHAAAGSSVYGYYSEYVRQANEDWDALTDELRRRDQHDGVARFFYGGR